MGSDAVDPFKLGELYKSLADLTYKFFTYRAADLKPCHSRIVREGRGLPLANRVVVHTSMDGRIGIKALKSDEPDPILPSYQSD